MQNLDLSFHYEILSSFPANTWVKPSNNNKNNESGSFQEFDVFNQLHEFGLIPRLVIECVRHVENKDGEELKTLCSKHYFKTP